MFCRRTLFQNYDRVRLDTVNWVMYYNVDWEKVIYKRMIIPTMNLGSALFSFSKSISKKNILFTGGLCMIENCKDIFFIFPNDLAYFCSY